MTVERMARKIELALAVLVPATTIKPAANDHEPDQPKAAAPVAAARADPGDHAERQSASAMTAR